VAPFETRDDRWAASSFNRAWCVHDLRQQGKGEWMSERDPRKAKVNESMNEWTLSNTKPAARRRRDEHTITYDQSVLYRAQWHSITSSYFQAWLPIVHTSPRMISPRRKTGVLVFCLPFQFTVDLLLSIKNFLSCVLSQPSSTYCNKVMRCHVIAHTCERHNLPPMHLWQEETRHDHIDILCLAESSRPLSLLWLGAIPCPARRFSEQPR